MVTDFENITYCYDVDTLALKWKIPIKQGFEQKGFESLFGAVDSEKYELTL